MTKRQSDFLDALILGLCDLGKHLPEDSTELQDEAFAIGQVIREEMFNDQV